MKTAKSGLVEVFFKPVVCFVFNKLIKVIPK